MSRHKKKSTFVFPLHAPHFAYGNTLVSSFNQYYSDYCIFIVFSNNEERAMFSSEFNDLSYEALVYPYPILNTDGIINKKKYYGIEQIIEKYDYEYIACIDSECKFFKQVDIDQRFKSFYRRKKIFATLSSYELLHAIISSPLKFFSAKEQDKLRDILHDEKAYFWFNEVPIYHRKTFQEFNRHLDIMNRFDEITWLDFDFIVYAYYCFLYQGFKLRILNKEVNSTGKQGLLELQSKTDKYEFLKYLFIIRPNWIRKAVFPYSKAFITFHHDRTEEELEVAQ